MLRYLDLNDKEFPSLEGKALLLGAFDGIHQGHLSLIHKALDLNVRGVAALYFDRNPSLFFSSDKSLKILSSPKDKERQFYRLGVEECYALVTSSELFSLTKEEFIKRILLPLNPSYIVVGEDYTFGKDGLGNIGDLKESFKVISLPLKKNGERKYGTQQIVSYIENGEIEKANKALVFPYEVVGTVIKGYQNGRKIGFPTANLSLKDDYLYPKRGVYAGIAYIRGLPYQAMINVGINPTVGKLKDLQIEAHLLDFDMEIYDETMYLSFYRYLREERKFSSLEELKSQLVKDLAEVRKVF